MKNNYAIIMAGGIGSRFWPISTVKKPKQFHDFLGMGKTLLQQTYDRMLKVAPCENIYFVINKAYKELVLSQVPQISEKQLITEPIALNTAPCIAYASYKIHSINPDAVLFVAPSDHLITFEDEFVRIAKIAIKKAETEKCLITLGIQPSRPETGFGYIQYKSSQERVKRVIKFTEKPDLQDAKRFLYSGDYLWNSGMFIWSAQSIIEAFQRLIPNLHKVFSKGKAVYFTTKEEEYINREYPKVDQVSIDYAIMERAKDVFVIPSSFGWSDLGTWNAIYDHLRKDENENAVQGKALVNNSKGSLVVSNKSKITLIEGLNDYFVIDTDDVLLICPKDNAEQIKQYIEQVNRRFGKSFV